MTIADLFDSIAERARADTDSAVRTYREQQRALEERLRIAAEKADHRRGSTREAMAARGAILLPADDIDLSPHTPAPTAPIPAAVPVADHTSPRAAGLPDQDDAVDEDDGIDFSFSSGWLTDR